MSCIFFPLSLIVHLLVCRFDTSQEERVQYFTITYNVGCTSFIRLVRFPFIPNLLRFSFNLLSFEKAEDCVHTLFVHLVLVFVRRPSVKRCQSTTEGTLGLMPAIGVLPGFSLNLCGLIIARSSGCPFPKLAVADITRTYSCLVLYFPP